LKKESGKQQSAGEVCVVPFQVFGETIGRAGKKFLRGRETDWPEGVGGGKIVEGEAWGRGKGTSEGGKPKSGGTLTGGEGPLCGQTGKRGGTAAGKNLPRGKKK